MNSVLRAFSILLFLVQGNVLAQGTESWNLYEEARSQEVLHPAVWKRLWLKPQESCFDFSRFFEELARPSFRAVSGGKRHREEGRPLLQILVEDCDPTLALSFLSSLLEREDLGEGFRRSVFEAVEKIDLEGRHFSKLSIKWLRSKLPSDRYRALRLAVAKKVEEAVPYIEALKTDDSTVLIGEGCMRFNVPLCIQIRAAEKVFPGIQVRSAECDVVFQGSCRKKKGSDRNQSKDSTSLQTDPKEGMSRSRGTDKAKYEASRRGWLH